METKQPTKIVRHLPVTAELQWMRHYEPVLREHLAKYVPAACVEDSLNKVKSVFMRCSPPARIEATSLQDVFLKFETVLRNMVSALLIEVARANAAIWLRDHPGEHNIKPTPPNHDGPRAA
jgi:hypothetical protein